MLLLRGARSADPSKNEDIRAKCSTYSTTVKWLNPRIHFNQVWYPTFISIDVVDFVHFLSAINTIFGLTASLSPLFLAATKPRIEVSTNFLCAPNLQVVRWPPGPRRFKWRCRTACTASPSYGFGRRISYHTILTFCSKKQSSKEAVQVVHAILQKCVNTEQEAQLL